MKKINHFALGGTLSMLTIFSVYAAPTPDGDGVSQAYALSHALQTQEHVPGISLLGGQITHSQPVISGQLPYVMSYVGSVRNSLSASNDYFDQFLTTGGWTDNYQNSVRFYSLNGSSTVGYYAIRLPGSKKDVWLSNFNRPECLGGVHQAYSSDTLGYLAYGTSANMVWKCTTQGYQFTESSSGGIIINYRGTTYTTTTSSATQAGTTYYRIASIKQPQGVTLNFSYDASLNMLSVADNKNNMLNFTRDYKKGATQTNAEKRLITKVALTSGVGLVQNALLTYASYNSQDANGKSGSIYYPTSVASTANGEKTFEYTPIKQWGVDGYLRFKNISVVNTNAAILTSIKDTTGVLQRQWIVAQNYANYDSNTKKYATAKVTLQVRSPVGSGYAQDYTVNYDDNERTVNVTTKPDGYTSSSSTYSISVLTKFLDGGSPPYYDDSMMTVQASGTLPAITIGGNRPKKIIIDTWDDYIDEAYFDKFYYKQYMELDGRLRSGTFFASYLFHKNTTYDYNVLSDGAVNPYNVPTTIYTPGYTISNIVNTKGQIIQQVQKGVDVDATSKVTDYTYYSNGLLNTVNGPLPGDVDKVTYVYDSYGNKASESQLVKGVVRTTQYLGYNSFAKPERIVYPNGLVDQFVYNPDGTLQKKVYGVGGTTGNISGKTVSYTYDTLKRVKTETNPDGEVTTYDYDTLGRVVKISHPHGGATHKTYHPNGALKAEETKDTAGVLLIASYQELDDNGRIAKIRSGTNENRYERSYLYDFNGNPLQVTSSLGTVETWTYDGYNRITSYTDGAGNTSTKNYDIQDNVISATDAMNSGSNPLVYTNGNLLKQEVNADFSTKTYSHDAADRVTQIAHHVRQCSYGNLDVLGRPATHTCVQNNGAAISGTYVHNYAYTYDATRFGRLESANSVGDSYGTNTSYTYDAYDRVIGKTQTVKAITAWSGTHPTRSVSYGYSTGGKMTSMTLPSGRLLNYSYDFAKGQATGISIDGSNLINNIAYNGAGQTLSWTWGNGSTYGIVYDVAKSGNIKTITNSTSANVQNYKADYVFDQDGRIVSITGLGTRDNYTYDRVNRLLTENRTNLSTNAAIFGITYTYDKNGNRLSLRGTGAHQQPAATVDYTYAANRNRLATITRNGVVTSPAHLTEGELRLDFVSGYDSHGQRRWSGMRNGDTTQPEYYFAYNHKRERTVRSIRNNGASWSANAIQYVYDEASHLIGEYTASGAPIVEYVWKGDVPIAAIYGPTSATKIYYIITDAQNTPRRLIDSSNNVVDWAWDSTAFGVAQPSVTKVNFNLRFPGQYYDPITKQHYNLNRYYNPEIGRYMEADPIGLEGGLNPYAYAGSNPVMNTDPSGLYLDSMNDIGLGNSFGDSNPINNEAFNSHLNRFDSMLNSAPIYQNSSSNSGGGGGSSYTVSVMINNNDRITGTHAGLVLTSPKEQVIWDPNGSFSYQGYSQGSSEMFYSNDSIESSDMLRSYMNYQYKDGSSVYLYKFNVSSQDYSTIFGKVDQGCARILPYCSSCVSSVISGIGPFSNVSPNILFPSNLKNALEGK